MPQEPNDPWLNGVAVAVAVGSLITWLFLLGRPRKWPFLPYEPRTSVPWEFPATLLAIAFLLTKLLEFFGGSDAAPIKPVVESSHVVQDLAVGIAMQTAIVLAFAAVVAMLSRATPRDLGLPGSTRQFIRDLKIGSIAWLAAIIPVYGIRLMTVPFFGEPALQPIVQLVKKNPTGMIWLLAFVMVGIAAPVCEEITFRLLLQGWLEKWEDRRLGRGGSATDATPTADYQFAIADELTTVDLNDGQAETPPAEPPWEPPSRSLAGLPHGWLPILVSSVAFSLAHIGHSSDPIPLYPLAIILGYTYQRTHRIVPCIVTHALFNSLTMFALWRSTVVGGH